MAGKDATATGTARATRTRYTSTIVVYALLLLARLASVLLPGYVHPDEFYQGGQELFFGVPLIPFLEARLLARDDVNSWAWVRPPSSRARHRRGPPSSPSAATPTCPALQQLHPQLLQLHRSRAERRRHRCHRR